MRIVGIWGRVTCGRRATNLGGVLILGMYRHIGTTSLSRLRLRSAENNVVLPETLCAWGNNSEQSSRPKHCGEIVLSYWKLHLHRPTVLLRIPLICQ